MTTASTFWTWHTRCALLLAAAIAGCSSDPSASNSDLAASNGDLAANNTACSVNIQTWPNEGQSHVAEGTPLTYATNPPSSGTHYGVWGRWGVHSQPLDRGYYVHNLEHGGVVLLYRCGEGCAEVKAALEAVLAARAADPACSEAVRTRLILTADPLLDVPVAATAWQNTYRAQCVDTPSLNAFIDAHYGRGPESTCAQGYVPPG
jgi:hypothetical protein